MVKELEKGKEKSAWREHISFVLSILAFILSGTTTYFSTLRQLDDLSVIAPTLPATYVSNNRIELTSFSLSLINAGNRSAVVHYIWIMIDQISEASSPGGCQHGEYAGVDTETAVVKEKEVIVKEIKATGLHDDPIVGVNLSPENVRRGFFPYEVCLRFFISTPSQALVQKSVSIMRTDKFDINKGFTGAGGLQENTRPSNLIHHNGNIFFD